MPEYSTIEFAYVYVLYYLDPNEESAYRRLHDFSLVVITSMRAARLLVEKRAPGEWQEINVGSLWRNGNYWIERQPVIDTFDHGLEWESQLHDGVSEKKTGHLPLVFERTE